ncbi:hypothetical protein OnM2_069030 [Erysiphe neolycopersici]|uniref:Mediator of RNA polymerase II transcription subunit 1 n=1 Tax=Erysiphe neolycopersici TaxID=212602 RepID=A0A420HLF5_9PEZI|nr:hypothetical protein OnM2_069030 [Erysiphe neolycopersici]
MATPTPGKQASVQAVATPPASTPFSSSNHLPYLAFSPYGPQSVVPSPQQVKKSPATSQMMLNNGTTGSFSGNYDSPSAAMALGSISGLSELGLDALSGVANPRRDDEEERKRKMDLVSEILKQDPGRVSELGIERLAKSVGLECLWEPKIVGENGTGTLIIAGSTLALEIDLDNNIVKSVSLTFPDNPESVVRHIERANGILLRDLILQKNESPLTKKLDRFSKNLKSLATLDKISTLPSVNCHEAIAGIYESLDRLFKWESQRLKPEEGMKIEKKVMCVKSGKPIMHARDKLGLSLDYWQDMWRIETKTEGLTWSILIECDTITPIVYTPLRVSKNWISAEVEKKPLSNEEMIMASENYPILDWLEPENTLLPATESGSIAEDGQSSNQKLPEVMFIAKFDPPLVVPGSLAAQIYDSVQAALDIYQATTYDGLIFPPKQTEKICVDSRSIFREVSVPIFSKTGVKTTRVHKVGLHFEKIDYGRTLSIIPFSHPKQLVHMLPALRQYALMTRLLLNPYDSLSQPPTVQKSSQHSKRDEFELFMSQELASEETSTKIDIIVYTHPFPRLRVLFPFKKRIADVHFEIKLNGNVEVIAQNILPEVSPEKSTDKIFTVADLGRMLEMTENLSIWIEYVKMRFE